MRASANRRLRPAGLTLALVLCALAAGAPAAHAGPCDAPVNQIACENSKPGTPESVWQVNGAGNDSIQGFATPFSVDHGQTVSFKVDTDATAYRIEIYRIGYYGGDGARQVAVLQPSAQLPQVQPSCARDATTGLVDCGTWQVSASWQVPANAVSGVYIARLVRPDTGGDSHIYFVVRDDARHADILYQTSDTTWQAYNQYGGASLYVGDPSWRVGRAFKVSYNRPVWTRGTNPNSSLFGGEYPLIRWMEANGYDVSYSSGIDTARSGGALLDHKIFMTGGHDEYWSKSQRANVEAARAAGVNLAFFAANNIFWKTRWESSVDGANTPFTTLVSYKETQDNAKSDPSPEWTGTWRDPRFSPPSDGGRPENALIGTIFTVNSTRDDALQVPYDYSRLRFWRDTRLASLQPGQTATLVPGILGHEWNEDLDNGFRPPGLIDLSSSTYDVDTYIQDYGSRYGPGRATHKLTLYRAPSGALVFSSATVRWGWGLDGHHDVGSSTPDPAIQQATANLFGDMGVRPTTLQSGLTQPSPSTDTTPPTATITSPTAGQFVPSGSDVTVTGTASDAGGGVVAGVEVSTDGGSTWHPATGTSSWSYTWTAGGVGPTDIKARAIDDSVNVQGTPASQPVAVSCPCSLWGDSTRPTTASTNDRSSIELGVRFQAQTDGYITGVRFYKGPQNTGTHVASLWSASGTLLARAPSTAESAEGWQQVTFDEPVAVTANTTYVASYHAPAGGYALDRPYFTNAYARAPLSAPADTASAPNGVYLYGSTPAFPTSTFGSSNYWVDVTFTQSPPADTTPPRVTSTSPADGATGADPRRDVTAQFSEALDPATIGDTTFVLRDASGATVPATVTYDAAQRSATLRPAAALMHSALYTATVVGGASGVKDRAGNALAADQSWSFTVAAEPTCPCSLFPASATPTVPSTNETNPIELGVRFRSDVAGYVSSIRFYKAPGGGPLTANLWTDTGTLLARVQVPADSAGGWHTAPLPTPVAIDADRTYVASYFSSSGNFAVDRGAFATQYSNPPLRAPVDGVGNGVFRYGTSTGFPNQSFGASNYWVDVEFNTTVATDTTQPTVDSLSPAHGATGVSVDAATTATFSEAIDAATLDTTTFRLADPAGNAVPAAVTYNAGTRTATLQPSSLAADTTYTATVVGGASGVKDTAGNALAADRTWSYTTASPRPCPCTLWDDTTVPAIASSTDTSGIELGVKFRADSDGYITGIRFYKGFANTGTHTGSLWTAAGTLLARAVFTNETTSGWQTLTFGTPVAVTANTTYVASYYAPSGGYALDRSYFATAYANAPLRTLSDADGGNGVYRYGTTPGFPAQSYGASNYWVDVSFARTVSQDTTPPTVASVTPADGATGVSVDTSVAATFSEALDPATLDGTTFELRDASGSAVPAVVTYDAPTQTATLKPSSLAGTTTYTATIKGGASGVKDTAGLALAADRTWSFTTASARPCPCSLWDDAAVPAIASASDTSAIEVGVRFQAASDGSVTGIRFYKGAANTGAHTGSLWTASGTLLARVTFANETASGWQTASFDTPVAITANTTYVASYFAPNGGFAIDRSYFGTAYANAPLRALADADGGNGVYRYNATPTFPGQSFGASNYWVDLVFAP